MDEIKAKAFIKKHCGEKINSYTLGDYIGNGKSAVVAKGRCGDDIVVIKIFDNDVVKKYDLDTHKKRIERELDLVNHGVNNLVNILDGGECKLDGIDYYYIVMDYVPGCTLSGYIKENKQLDESFCKNLFKTLYAVTEDLLDMGIVHRDIKPDNIMITPEGGVVLLDLGVLKPINNSNITDVGDEMKPFLGTQRYASPEYLLREEKQDKDGWKSLNIYQIAATLFEALMGVQFFHQYQEPYTKISDAIIHESISVSRFDIDIEFVMLINNLLIKNPQKRLEIFEGIDIDRILKDKDKNSVEYKENLLLEKMRPHQEREAEIRTTKEEITKKIEELSDIKENMYNLTNNFLLNLKKKKIISDLKYQQFLSNRVYESIRVAVSGKLEQGFWGEVVIDLYFPKELENCDTRIIAEIKQPNGREPVFKSRDKAYQFYNGIFNEELFKNKIENVLINIIEIGTKHMENDVKNEYEFREKLLKDNINIKTTFVKKNYIIDKDVLKSHYQ